MSEGDPAVKKETGTLGMERRPSVLLLDEVDVFFGDGFYGKPRIQANGRVVMDMMLVEVKSPKDSKSKADLYRVVETIPGDTLFTPADKSGCPLTTAG